MRVSNAITQCEKSNKRNQTLGRKFIARQKESRAAQVCASAKLCLSDEGVDFRGTGFWIGRHLAIRTRTRADCIVDLEPRTGERSWYQGLWRPLPRGSHLGITAFADWFFDRRLARCPHGLAAPLNRTKSKARDLWDSSCAFCSSLSATHLLQQIVQLPRVHLDAHAHAALAEVAGWL
jgi:hypothetical protein